MRINTLTLKGFRSHADTTLELPRLTFIRGANHVGKSSIPYALEYLFAGRCPGTSSDGKGAASLVMEGQKGALIQADTAECEIRANGARKGDAPAPSRDVTSCLMNSGYLFGMSAADQKALLSSLVLPADYTFEAWVSDAISTLNLGHELLQSGIGLNDTIAAVYEKAFAERTVINRTIKSFVVPSGDTKAAKDPSEVEGKLTGLREELATLKGKQQAGQAAVLEYDKRVAKANDAIADATAKVSREEQEIPAIKGRILTDAVMKEKQGIAKNATRLQELARELAGLDAIATERRTLRDRLMKLRAGRCPTCQQELTEDSIAAVAGEVVKQYDEASGKANAVKADYMALGDPASAQRAVEAHEQAKADLKRAEGRVDDAKKALAKLQAVATGERPALGQDFTADIVAVQERITKGESVVREIYAANQLVQRQEESRKQLAELESKRDLLERLVTEFGPKGLKARLLDENIHGFESAMNNVLARWGYQCKLQFEPYSMGIVTQDGVLRELAYLSESEQHRFAIAFQVALAEWSKWNFVVIDRVDMLDQASRQALNSLLWKSSLEQAIVCTTDERTEAKSMAGVAVYRFTAPNGVTEVERLS